MGDYFFEHSVLRKLDAILALLGAIQTKETADMAALDDSIANLNTKVTGLKTVEDSAVALITGIPALIAAAVNQALAAGATPAQLQALTDLGAALDANAAPLAAAVTANTPTPPPAAQSRR